MALGHAAEPAPAPAHVETAYLDGQAVSFNIASLPRSQRGFRIGPWNFGQRILDSRPHDKRLNLYLVFPGMQHHADGFEEFDHNWVINALPGSDEPIEWDVYWVMVLDPHFNDDLRSERQLLLAAQSRFFPADLLEFDDIPSEPVLRAVLRLESLEGLARFRARNATLPRLAIVPAGFAIRARAASTGALAN